MSGSIDTRVPRRVVVASHGMGDTAATWDAVVPGLSSAADVRCWLLRGHGDRPWDGPGDYLVDAASADLAAEVEAATTSSGSPVVLLGHSLGGYLSLITRCADPTRWPVWSSWPPVPVSAAPNGGRSWNDYALSVGERAGFPARSLRWRCSRTRSSWTASPIWPTSPWSTSSANETPASTPALPTSVGPAVIVARRGPRRRPPPPTQPPRGSRRRRSRPAPLARLIRQPFSYTFPGPVAWKTCTGNAA